MLPQTETHYNQQQQQAAVAGLAAALRRNASRANALVFTCDELKCREAQERRWRGNGWTQIICE